MKISCYFRKRIIKSKLKIIHWRYIQMRIFEIYFEEITGIKLEKFQTSLLGSD